MDEGEFWLLEAEKEEWGNGRLPVFAGRIAVCTDDFAALQAEGALS